MKVDLSDQVAVVTGGAAGIGRAIVSTLADNGARVVIVDVDAERARSTATRSLPKADRAWRCRPTLPIPLRWPKYRNRFLASLAASTF